MLSLAAAALALYDSSKPKEGDVYYATVKNFHSVVLSQPGAVAVQFFDYSCTHCKAWVASVRTIVSALDADDPARVPNVPAHRAADDREQLVSMVANDQFSFAHLVTPTHVHPALRALGLRQKELHRRFNWRGDEPVPSHLVLNHSPRIKEDALTKYEEKKKEWEARAAERRALEAPPSPPKKRRRRKAKKEEL